MPAYANLSGKSGVTNYEISADSITVWFRRGSPYVYTYASAGEANIEQMKVLAESGQGLGAFINTVVKHLYASKS